MCLFGTFLWLSFAQSPAIAAQHDDTYISAELMAYDGSDMSHRGYLLVPTCNGEVFQAIQKYVDVLV